MIQKLQIEIEAKIVPCPITTLDIERLQRVEDKWENLFAMSINFEENTTLRMIIVDFVIPEGEDDYVGIMLNQGDHYQYSELGRYSDNEYKIFESLIEAVKKGNDIMEGEFVIILKYIKKMCMKLPYLGRRV